MISRYTNPAILPSNATPATRCETNISIRLRTLLSRATPRLARLTRWRLNMTKLLPIRPAGSASGSVTYGTPLQQNFDEYIARVDQTSRARIASSAASTSTSTIMRRPMTARTSSRSVRARRSRRRTGQLATPGSFRRGWSTPSFSTSSARPPIAASKAAPVARSRI